MVYVISIDRKPLMPTSNAKARILLREKKAKVKEVKPFTIQLTYKTETDYTQDITLGIDSGYSNVGFSAITEKKEILVGELKLLQGMKERLQEKAMYKIQRRSRLRYRAPRFDNRKKSKPDGWLAPSLQHKLDSHLKFIDYLYSILPITKCVVEVANFDIQKMNNDAISGIEYQQGDMVGFWNLRDYILHRDNHSCQNPNCQNKDKEKILEVHHIKYKSLGGTDNKNNLITLCSKCHTSPNHKKGKFLWGWCQEGKKVRGFKDATFMSTVRWYLVNNLKEKYSDVSITYGYITKNHRIENGIDKTHYNDAFAIAKGINQARNETVWSLKQVRRNNRSLEKFYDAKYTDIRTGEKVSGKDLNSGRRTRNKNHNTENLHQYRGKKLSKGQRRIRKGRYFYQPNDLVKYEGRVFSVKGTQNKGKYVKLDGLKKVPRVDALNPYRFNKGIVWM